MEGLGVGKFLSSIKGRATDRCLPVKEDLDGTGSGMAIWSVPFGFCDAVIMYTACAFARSSYIVRTKWVQVNYFGRFLSIYG